MEANGKTPSPKAKGKLAPRKRKFEKPENKSKSKPKKSDEKKGGGGCFGGDGDGKKTKGDQKGSKEETDKKAKGMKRASSPAWRGTKSPQGSPKESPKASPKGSAKGSPSPSRRSPSQTGDAGSRKLRFDEAVRVKEIPDRFESPTASWTINHGSVPMRSFPAEGSEHDTRTDPKYGDPIFGSKLSSRSPCPKDSKRKDPDLCSTDSMTLDEPGPIFDPNRCPAYSRGELISMLETLVLGINERELLKARYDDENKRLAMTAQLYAAKAESARTKLEFLRDNAKKTDKALRESFD